MRLCWVRHAAAGCKPGTRTHTRVNTHGGCVYTASRSSFHACVPALTRLQTSRPCTSVRPTPGGKGPDSARGGGATERERQRAREKQVNVHPRWGALEGSKDKSLSQVWKQIALILLV